ncbi:MAG: Na+/H+ antiporter NhaC family protein [Brevinema sp.]
MRKYSSFFLFICLVAPIVVFGQARTAQENADFFSFWTILPPLLAILLAFITRQVLLSLFMGIWAGTLILSFSDGISILDIFTSFGRIPTLIISSMASSGNAAIILQVLTIGGLIAVIGRNGGAYAVAEAIASKAKTARSAQFLTWFLGLFIFFDDYANCLITGPVMRPVTDKLKISRAKLAFIVDATAAPISGIALISTWIGYELGVMTNGFELAGLTDVNVYGIFLQTIPYRFYNIFILGMIVLIGWMNRDFGPMLAAEARARKGILNDDTEIEFHKDSSLDAIKDIPLNIWNGLVPIFTLIFAAMIGFYYSGYQELASSSPELLQTLKGSSLLVEILGNADAGFVIFNAALLATLSAFVMSSLTKTLTLKQSIKIWLEGAKNLFANAVVILLLAWSISMVIKELGTHVFLADALRGILNPLLLPGLIFTLGLLISFSTGTSYGTMGILMPLTIPLAVSLAPENHVVLVSSIGAVLTGAIVGDHCSPISDTTILSSVGAECSLIEHTRTQLPYGMFIFAVSLLFGYLATAFGLPVMFSYIIGFAVICGVLLFVGKNPQHHIV